MLRRLAHALILGAVLAAPFPVSGWADDKAQSLASIRAEVEQLSGSLQKLRSELDAGGAPAMQAAGGTSAIDRMNAIEAELTRLTRQTEALSNRIKSVVADGTNRIGDLEFRLCELEKGCDTSKLPQTPVLGGAAASAGGDTTAAASGNVAGAADAGAGTSGATTQPELALNEQADFDKAKAALDKGDYQQAADLFATFSQDYTGGPLSGEASFLRGEALSKLGQTAAAARSYLDAFSGQPNGPHAAASLLKLGASLGMLGQSQEACVTLREVGTRFPGAPEAAEAQTAMQSLSCQ